MRNATTIMIPTERRDQLKALGAVLNKSIPETIAYLIRKEIDAGTIPDTLPGIVVERVKAGIRLQFDGHPGTVLPLAAASALAEKITEVASGGPSVVMPKHFFAVVRAGKGIKIQAPITLAPQPFNVDVALDLARLIEQAAEQAVPAKKTL